MLIKYVGEGSCFYCRLHLTPCACACAHAGRSGRSVCVSSTVGEFVLRELGERAALKSCKSPGCLHMRLTHSADVDSRLKKKKKSHIDHIHGLKSLTLLLIFFFFFVFHDTGRMESEEQALDASLSVCLGVGDMEAVEALMSMMKHGNTPSFRVRHPRPLTPSSDCSDDDSAPVGTVAMQDSPLVRPPSL